MAISSEASKDFPADQWGWRMSRIGAAWFRLTFAVMLLAWLISDGNASTAVRFIVSNDPCVIQACPGDVPPPTTVEAGRSFEVFVSAQDAVNSVDRSYVGPAVVTSSDAGAVLPVSLTFSQGQREFAAILTTVGDQTITVTDPARGITGSFTMTVTAPASAPVPVLSNTMRLLFLSALAGAGIWLVRTR
jgi:hypothetical protein